MSSRRHRAVLVFLPTLDQARQERIMLDWVDKHRYDLTAVTHMPGAAAALAEAGLVDVVVVVRHTRATLEAAGRIGQTGATVDEVRPSGTPLTNHDRTRAQILDASRRGVPVDAIALVLDIPVATVHEALGIGAEERRPVRSGNVRSISSATRRPQRVPTGPPGRP